MSVKELQAKTRANMKDKEWRKFIVDLVALERRASNMGLHKTARSLNKATQDAGWERSQKIKVEDGKIKRG